MARGTRPLNTGARTSSGSYTSSTTRRGSAVRSVLKSASWVTTTSPWASAVAATKQSNAFARRCEARSFASSPASSSATGSVTASGTNRRAELSVASRSSRSAPSGAARRVATRPASQPRPLPDRLGGGERPARLSGDEHARVQQQLRRFTRGRRYSSPSRSPTGGPGPARPVAWPGRPTVDSPYTTSVAAFLSLGAGDDVRYRSAMNGERHRRAGLHRGDDPRGVVAKVSHRYIHVPQRSTPWWTGRTSLITPRSDTGAPARTSGRPLNHPGRRHQDEARRRARRAAPGSGPSAPGSVCGRAPGEIRDRSSALSSPAEYWTT